MLAKCAACLMKKIARDVQRRRNQRQERAAHWQGALVGSGKPMARHVNMLKRTRSGVMCGTGSACAAAPAARAGCNKSRLFAHRARRAQRQLPRGSGVPNPRTRTRRRARTRHACPPRAPQQRVVFAAHPKRSKPSTRSNKRGANPTTPPKYPLPGYRSRQQFAKCTTPPRAS